MSTFDPTIHHRRSIRLPEHDYSSPGSYFVTICTQERAETLSRINELSVELTAVGQIVDDALRHLADRFSAVVVDAYVIMPNHVHVVISIMESSDSDAPDRVQMNAKELHDAQDIKVTTLGQIVRTFKASSARIIRRDVMQDFGWQRNYFERVIRSKREFDDIYDYVLGNPASWSRDELNPLTRRE